MAWKPMSTTKKEMTDAVDELSIICRSIKTKTLDQSLELHQHIGKLQAMAENLKEEGKHHG